METCLTSSNWGQNPTARARTEQLRETLQIVKALWTEKQVTFHILLVIGVGLASVLIAALGGVGYASLSGWIYLVNIPMHYISPFIAQRFWKYAES